MSQEAPISTYSLKGHKGPVLCLDYHFESSLLLSGSEDNTARVWDLRTNRASICFTCQGNVLSTVFGPKLPSNDDASPFVLDRAVYLAVENKVYLYDLRNNRSPIVAQDTPHSILLDSVEDEVNQIVLSQPRPKQPLHMAFGSDVGTVHVSEVFSERDYRNTKILNHNDIVTCVDFRPKSKRMEIASGGTDCRIVLWDVSKAKRALSSCTVHSLGTNANQVCNPPMVHSLKWSPSGRFLAAGLGDGSCALFGVENGGLVMQSRIEDAHSDALASVLFPSWNGTSAHVTANDRLFMTTGNDGMVVFWDLERGICGEDASGPRELLPIDQTIEARMEDLSFTTPPMTLFALNHGRKPNWLVSSHINDPNYPKSLFLSDTSNDITIYKIT